MGIFGNDVVVVKNGFHINQVYFNGAKQFPLAQETVISDEARGGWKNLGAPLVTKDGRANVYHFELPVQYSTQSVTLAGNGGNGWARTLLGNRMGGYHGKVSANNLLDTRYYRRTTANDLSFSVLVDENFGYSTTFGGEKNGRDVILEQKASPHIKIVAKGGGIDEKGQIGNQSGTGLPQFTAGLPHTKKHSFSSRDSNWGDATNLVGNYPSGGGASTATVGSYPGAMGLAYWTGSNVGILQFAYFWDVPQQRAFTWENLLTDMLAFDQLNQAAMTNKWTPITPNNIDN